MRREWTPEDLIASWTLVDADWALVGNKTGATRLGFVALLKFFELEGRFPPHLSEVPKTAVIYLAQQAALPTEQIAGYDRSGRQVKRHRAQIRSAMGFREPTVEDEEALAAWLAEDFCQTELGEERQLGAAACPLSRRAPGAARPEPARPGAGCRPGGRRAAVLRPDRGAPVCRGDRAA